jgi:ABC-type transporter Mla subunit MlaD
LNRENELFNSILKSFNQAVKTPSLRPGLIQQMVDIAKQTTERRTGVKGDLQRKSDALARADEQHRALLEQQRRYFQVVKEYQVAYETLSRLHGEA